MIIWVTIQLATCSLTVSSDYYQTNGRYAIVSPREARTLADTLGVLLPTPWAIDRIHEAATCKPVTSAKQHGATSVIQQQQDAAIQTSKCRNTLLVSGTFKDIVVGIGGKLGIYGWNGDNGFRQKPFYGHSVYYRDYSQGVRFIHPESTCRGVLDDK